MEITPQLIQDLGISGVTLAIIFWIVRYFVTAIKSKDKHIQDTTKEFTRVVANHIEHNNQAINTMNSQTQNMISVLDKNTRVIHRVYEKLDDIDRK